MPSDRADPLFDPDRLAAVRRLGLTPEVGPRFTRIVRLAAAVLDAPLAFVSVIDTEERVLCAASGGEPVALGPFPLAHSFGRRVTGGRPWVADDTRRDPATADNPSVEALGMAAYAGVPLVVDGHAVGALAVVDARVREWSEADVETLVELAGLAVSEIARFRAEAALRRQSHLLAAAADALGEGLVVVSPDGATVVANRLGNEVLPGEGDLRRTGGELFAPGEYPLDRAVAEGSQVVEDVVRRGPEDWDGHWYRVTASPVWLEDGTPAGAFCVVAPRAPPALRAGAPAEAPGFADRRTFVAEANQRLGAGRRDQTAHLLYIVRIRDLDRVRERFGDVKADEAVADVESVLREAFREEDLLGRMAPDALVVLARDTGAGEAGRALGRIQLGVAERNMGEPRGFSLTVGVGVAGWDAAGAASLDQLLLRADASARAGTRAREATV